MLSFRLSTLSTSQVSPDILAAWELAALFLGAASVLDLPIDQDEARAHYIENYVAEAERADYIAEPNMADAEMMESFEGALVLEARSRIDALGTNYPFLVDDHNNLVRKPEGEVSGIGSCYLALQFYRALNGKTIELDGATEAEIKASKNSFDLLFPKIFEYIAGYTIAGSNNGAAYMTSDSRSAARLERLLGTVCKKIGFGAVHPHAHWNPRQKSTNDGGVDCLVHIGGPGTPGSAELALVGATIQRASIDQKIIGPEKKDFFRSFFSVQPAAFKGILVRAQDEDPLTKDKCVQKDCLLFTYEHIWKSMGTRTGGSYQATSLTRLDAKVRKLLKQISGSKFLHEYEVFTI